MSDTAAQQLHDKRVNRTRGKQRVHIPRTCILCGRNAAPRWLYCCDEHAAQSKAEATAALIAGGGKKKSA